MANRTNVWARRKSRRALVQAVYQWQLSDDSYTHILENFKSGEALVKADVDFFREILTQVIHGAADLDQHYEQLLDRSVAQLDQVERAILRLATAEFSGRIDVPYKVVIDEYVELAKTFGAQDSHKYINGVLDKLALTLREVETAARQPAGDK